MRTTSMRLVAAIIATSLGAAGVVPPALAQQPTLPSEQTPLEQSEQPMPPAEPPVAQAPPVMPSPEPTMAQAQQPPVVPPAPVQPAPPMLPIPATPPPPIPPAPTAQPTQPDLFQETLKAQRSAERKQGLYEAGAVVTNVFLVPGRAITCALGATVGVAVLAITLGTGYKTAAAAFDEGCGGKWVVNGDDLKPDGGSRSFDWER